MPLFPQRPPTTGSRLYTNADLQDRPALGVTIERPNVPVSVANPPQRQPGDRAVEALLAEAQNSLANANGLDESITGPQPLMDEASVGAPDADYARYNSEVPNVTDSVLGRFKKNALHYLKTRPEVLSNAAAVDAFIPGPVGVPGRLVQGAEGVADFANSGGVNNAINHPTQGALQALQMLAGLSGLKSLDKGARVASRFMNGEGAVRKAARAAATAEQEAAAVRGTVEAANDYVKGGATKEQAAQRAGWPLGQSEASPINHSHTETATPISELMTGEDGTYRRPDAMGNPMDALRRLAPGQAPVTASFGRPIVPPTNPRAGWDEISAMRQLLRQASASNIRAGF